LLVTVAAVLAASGIAWMLWRMVFNTNMPIFVLGAIGGVVAAAMWRFLRRGDAGS
jgi:hypothetical protein